MPVVMTADEILQFLEREFPQSLNMGFSIESVSEDGVVMRQPVGPEHLRPGGTVSGPTLMALVDCAAYLDILSRIGPVGLAVTTNLSIDFLRRPQPGAIIARTTMLKLGKRLAVVRIDLTSEADADRLVACSTVTYSIPPR